MTWPPSTPGRTASCAARAGTPKTGTRTCVRNWASPRKRSPTSPARSKCCRYAWMRGVDVAEAEHGDLEGRHHVRDSEGDEPLSAMMKDYTDRVTDAMQEMGAHAAAAPEVAAQVAEHTARLISKQ